MRASTCKCRKPIARSLDDADRMLAAAERTGASLRVLEDYLFYPPLAKLHDVIAGGEIGDPVAVHMKIVASGRGGWDVPLSSYVWQFEQARDGRGILTFDHGWHQLAVAYWLFGPIRRVFGWIGASPAAPELAPEIMIDAPATFVWEHAAGVRGVLDIALARDMYFHSDYYTGDERIEVTGTRGYARCNRISARGIQEPALVVYRDGETCEYHALPDRPPDAFAAMTAAGIGYRRGAILEEPLLGATHAREVLRVLLLALESSARGGPIDL
jgi:predicted dehydrogenase